MASTLAALLLAVAIPQGVAWGLARRFRWIGTARVLLLHPLVAGLVFAVLTFVAWQLQSAAGSVGAQEVRCGGLALAVLFAIAAGTLVHGVLGLLVATLLLVRHRRERADAATA